MSILTLVAVLGAAASGTPPVCPRTITDRQIVTAPSSGTAIRYSKGPRKLAGVAVFAGHPKKRMSIRGDDWTRKDQVVWEFNGKADVWLECDYQGSAAVLQIHAGRIKSCTYIKRPDIGGGGLLKCAV